MKQVKCAVCGTIFKSNRPNVKYCSEACRKEGTKAAKRKWREKSGQLEKDKERLSAYRKKKEAEAQARKERKLIELKEAEAKADLKRQKQATADLQEEADEGTPPARLKLALRNSGRTSVEYWQAFKEYDAAFAQSWNCESLTTVNGISVNNPNFAELVIISIEELKVISVISKLRKEVEKCEK